MRPSVWGKHVWYTIHFVALQFPDPPSEREQMLYFEFYKTLSKVLPCGLCREHFKVVWSKHPLTTDRLSSREALFAWTVEVHNLVNEDLGKPRMALKDARELYLVRKPEEEPSEAPSNGGCEPAPVLSDQTTVSASSVETSVDLMEACITVALLLLVLLNVKKNRILEALLRFGRRLA